MSAFEIIWVSLNSDKACHDATDAGIVEVRLARFVGRQQNSPYGEGRFAPYFLSLTGTAGVVALANAHSNNSSIAATLAVINNYSTMQANIGAHDATIPGSAVPPPAPGTVAALLQTCAFAAGGDGIIRLDCASP